MKHKSTKTIQNLSTASILCPIFNFSITTTISIMNSSPHCISHHLGIQSLESAGGVCKQNTLAFLVYESGEARFSVWTRGPQTERSAFYRPIPETTAGSSEFNRGKKSAPFETNIIFIFQASIYRGELLVSGRVSSLVVLWTNSLPLDIINDLYGIHNWFCSATDVDQVTSTEMRLLWYRMSPPPAWWKVNIYRNPSNLWHS